MERGPKDSKKNAYLYNQTVQSWLNSMWSFETELLSVSEKTPPVVGFSHFSEVSWTFQNLTPPHHLKHLEAHNHNLQSPDENTVDFSGVICMANAATIVGDTPKKPRITGFSLFTASVCFFKIATTPPSTKQAQTCESCPMSQLLQSKWLSPFLWRWWFHSHQRRNPERLLGLGLSVLQCGGPW